MKKAIITMVVILTGCSSFEPEEQKLIVEKKVQPLSRNEVITAINECESSGTRAVMVYGKRKINGQMADIVADVTCAPRFFPGGKYH